MTVFLSSNLSLNTMPTTDSERYPIGAPERGPSPSGRAAHLEAIRSLPERFAAAYRGLDSARLETPYREGGWTLRQVAHHVADSHMNAWVRMKLALTEEWPVIKPYNEKLWAETAETRGSVEAPLALLTALHGWMSELLAALREDEWARGYVHPESGRTSMEQVAALYSWHGRHHTAHVTGLRERMGW
jgi:hypothetical protein